MYVYKPGSNSICTQQMDREYIPTAVKWWRIYTAGYVVALLQLSSTTRLVRQSFYMKVERNDSVIFRT